MMKGITMNHRYLRAALAAAFAAAAGCALTASRMDAAPGQDSNARPPVPLAMPASAPKGATELFTGRADQIKSQWIQRYTQNPAGWTVDSSGAATPNKTDIATKAEFGDCYVHVEYRTPADSGGNPVGTGNAGIGLQGRYEIQMMSSHGQPPRKNGNASMYNQRPPMVNASKKAGEWQSFDIIFRAPRFDPAGAVTEKPRATVFHNGVLVHNNEDFTGMTGINYNEFKEMAKTGPIVLQGDHEPVQFRNIWIVPQ